MDWLTAPTPLIIGHRGASAEMPENTLAAFALAQEQGAAGIELDVQLSADGQVVVIHDHTVDRTTNGTGRVSAMSLAQLQELDAGQGQTIPTLDEVFETFGPNLLYNVELKNSGRHNAELAAAVADRIAAHHLERHTLVSSFSPLAVRHARRHLTRTTPVAHLRQYGWQRFVHSLIPAAADHPHHTLVNEKSMAWARRRGLRVHVWTVDDPGRAQQLVALGVHGIITNRPQLIRTNLT